MIASVVGVAVLAVAATTAAPPATTPEAIALHNDVATARFERVLLDGPLPQGVVPLGYTSCFTQWETEFWVDVYGERMSSTCYSLVDITNAPSEEGYTTDLTAIASGSVEHLADGTVRVWGINIYTSDRAAFTDVIIPEATFNSAGVRT